MQQIEMVINMLNDGLSAERTARIARMSVSEVIAIKDSYDNNKI